MVDDHVTGAEPDAGVIRRTESVGILYIPCTSPRREPFRLLFLNDVLSNAQSVR